MSGKMIRTNKGTFKVRYVYSKFNPVHGDINVIVILDEKNEMPFTGEFGDEIPMLSTYREQYKVVVL